MASKRVSIPFPWSRQIQGPKQCAKGRKNDEMASQQRSTTQTSENRAERTKITSHPQNTTKSKQTNDNTVKAGQDKSNARNNAPRAAKMMKRLVNNGRHRQQVKIARNEQKSRATPKIPPNRNKRVVILLKQNKTSPMPETIHQGPQK